MSSYTDIYFAILSISTLAITGLLVSILFYALSILRDIKKLSSIAKKEAEFIANSVSRGASLLGADLSSEAAGFVKTIFTLLISKVVGGASSTRKRTTRQKTAKPNQ
jgi:hypothetical protein